MTKLCSTKRIAGSVFYPAPVLGWYLSDPLNAAAIDTDKYDHFALRSHLQLLGISLRSATEPIEDTSTGKLMEGVLAAFAQFDNDVRSERTRAA